MFGERNVLERTIFIGMKHLQSLINKADARITVSEQCLQHWQLKEENTWMLWNAVCSLRDCCYERVKQPYVLFRSFYVNNSKGAGKAVEAFGKSGLYAEYSNKCVPPTRKGTFFRRRSLRSGTFPLRITDPGL